MRLLSKIKRTNQSFLIDFILKERPFPSFILKLEQSLSGEVIFEENENPSKKVQKKEIYTISDFPGYYKPEISTDRNTQRVLKVPLYIGYLINLRSFDSLEDYIDTIVRKARYSQLRRYRKRLDLCLSPTYEIYYGNIAKDTYDFVFSSLKIMIQRRFVEKKEDNFELPYFDLYQESMYPLILKKKAALFVIYDRDKPINITLNFIKHTTVFHWNSCHDIDYSMFNLGHINMMNHLKWSYDQGFEVFDMGMGDFFHKRKWITDRHLFQEYIVYDPTAVSTRFLSNSKAVLLKTRYNLINFLKKMKLHLVYSKYVKYKYNIVHGNKTNDQKIKWQIYNDNFSIPPLDKLVEVNLEASENYLLIKPFNYFLHKSQESVIDVGVYADTKNSKEYYFIGKKKKQRIEVQFFK